jgi:hypothetical protein
MLGKKIGNQGSVRQARMARYSQQFFCPTFFLPAHFLFASCSIELKSPTDSNGKKMLGKKIGNRESVR